MSWRSSNLTECRSDYINVLFYSAASTEIPVLIRYQWVICVFYFWLVSFKHEFTDFLLVWTCSLYINEINTMINFIKNSCVVSSDRYRRVVFVAIVIHPYCWWTFYAPFTDLQHDERQSLFETERGVTLRHWSKLRLGRFL